MCRCVFEKHRIGANGTTAIFTERYNAFPSSLNRWREFRGEIKMMKIMRTPFKSGNSFARCISSMALLILVFASIPAHSQVVGAGLSGTITDESHGAIPNATLSIENVATGVTTTVTTNDQGIYNAPNL